MSIQGIDIALFPFFKKFFYRRVTVKVVKMTQEDFELVKGKMIADYTKEKIKYGIWAEEEALELSKETFNTLLAKGINTENNYLYNVIDEEGNKVAYVWFARRGTEAYLYNIDIFEAYKDKVDYKDLYTLIEDVIFSTDATKISIHIFGYNSELIEKYKEYGFDILDVTLGKKL